MLFLRYIPLSHNTLEVRDGRGRAWGSVGEWGICALLPTSQRRLFISRELASSYEREAAREIYASWDCCAVYLHDYADRTG
jgi:hypothetical protein